MRNIITNDGEVVKQMIEEAMEKEEQNNTDLATENSPNKNVTNTNQNPENTTSNMEVHHHGHAEHKQKWKDYLFQFFMLFLAVFCGFLAEYYLEHKLEHDREKVLALSMYEDLKKDKLGLEDGILLSQKKIDASEKLTNLLQLNATKRNDTLLYTHLTTILTSIQFTTTDGTYQQMKSAGSLRYFKQPLVNLMNAYDNQSKKTVHRETLEEKANWELFPYAATIVNFEVNMQMRFKQPITKPMYVKLRNADTKDLLVNKIITVVTMRMRLFQEYEAQLKLTNNLLKTLKEEYKIKKDVKESAATL